MASKIILGGAHIDERGQAHGGDAGDQTKKEVCEKSFYVHKLGWRVFRAKTKAKRTLIANAMRAACANDHIGYDQYARDTLYNEAAKHGFNPQLVEKNVETDCSALVRVCCAYAGIRLENFRTWNEPDTLLKSGQFVEIEFSTNALTVGDILCTPVAGHTEIVVYAEGKGADDIKMDEIARGYRGYQCKVLQQLLNLRGCGLIVDGVAGEATVAAIKTFQRDKGLVDDGICGTKTWTKILKGV